MSGFDPAWLDLREPVDLRSRSKVVIEAVEAAFGGQDEIAVADIACGAGSMLRALAPRLPKRQSWTLIDHDEALLAHARVRLAEWADDAEERDGRLSLHRDGFDIEVETLAVDLSKYPLPDAAAAADLVTASALFDLVGREWLDAFAARLTAAQKPLYAALTYDGRKSFSPPDPLDEAVLAAFNRHQTTDKGFGPALGPGACDALAAAFRTHGYGVVEGDSPWRLDSGDAALAGALIEGVATAAAETTSTLRGLRAWFAQKLALLRAADGASVEVGHRDMFARPE